MKPINILLSLLAVTACIAFGYLVVQVICGEP
jgi:hypothetical protein